ncbi:MAG: RluA family pseudouridine synthase [Lachnospiraceae bacterium]|nr:RluA family pseudouridine synthase [Lachnospiraceae bacterium]
MGFGYDDILMEDKELLVVRKQAGMAVQSAKFGQMDLEHALLNYLSEQRERQSTKPKGQGSRSNGTWQMPYLAVIHRLDQPVEGLLVFAKTQKAAAALNSQLQNGKMKKEYLAICRGKMEKEQGKLVDYLVKDGRTNTSRVAERGTAGARRSELEYRQIAWKEETGESLLEIHLLSGRHHQIRVQLSHAGNPLKGDRKYGGMGGAGRQENVSGRDCGLALCAFRLSFFHPSTGEKLCFCTAPKGAAFADFADVLPEK